MKKLLSKLYKLAPNGKKELFGIDGIQHAVASILIMSIVYGLLYTQYGKEAAQIGNYVTWVIMRIFWYLTEHFQEKKMWQNNPNRPKNLWKFWDWSKARKVDMYYPAIGDTLFVIGGGLV